MSPAEKAAREEMAERKMQDATEKAYSKSLTKTEYAPEKKDPRDAVRGQKGYAKGGMTASAGIVTSSADINFPQATASWGSVGYLGILDALSSGNLLMHTALTTAKTIDTGDILKITSGNLTVTLD